MTLTGDEEHDRAAGAPHPRFAPRLVGHAAQERSLLDDYRLGRLPHAIILGGQAGIGKATLAWLLTKFLLTHPCPASPEVQAADHLDVPPTGRAAVQVESLAHPDIALLRREMNEKTKRVFTEIRTDDVRRAIGLFQRAAGAGGYRICIIDSAEDLNRSSANALLKLIEEPPPKSLFLMISHRPGLILPTIRSRARMMRLHPLDDGVVKRIVRGLGAPWSDIDDEALTTATARARGSVRETLRILGQGGTEFGLEVRRLLDRLPAIDWHAVHKLADFCAGRDGETAYEATLTTIFDWIGEVVRRDPSQGPRRLVPYAEVWEKVARSARETDALNLDKRPLLLSIFSDLAAAARATAA